MWVLILAWGCGDSGKGAPPGETLDPGAYHDNDGPGPLPVTAVAVYHLLKAGGDTTASFKRIQDALPAAGNHVDLGSLVRFLSARHIRSEVCRETLSALLGANAPALVLTRAKCTQKDLRSGRLGVCLGREGEGVLILDPRTGLQILNEADLAARHLGVTLRLDPTSIPPARNAPDLVCRETVWSYGEMPSGAMIHHGFQVQNAGTRPLNITRVETSCGCAAAVMGRKGEVTPELIRRARPEKDDVPARRVLQVRAAGIIPPGGSMWINACVNTTYKQGARPFRILLRTDDPEEPEAMLVMAGTLARVYEIEPLTLWFREIRSSRGASAHVWIRHAHKKSFRLSDIRTSCDRLKVAVDPDPPREAHRSGNAIEARALPSRAHPSGEGWSGLEVRVLPGVRVGHFAERLGFKADDHAMEIPVVGLVKGNLDLHPPYFNFGHVTPGEAKTVEATVSSRLGEGLVVNRVEVSLGFMHARVAPVKKGVFRIVVWTDPGWASSNLKGTAVLHTNDPLEPQKKVDVYGFLKRS